MSKGLDILWVNRQATQSELPRGAASYAVTHLNGLAAFVAFIGKHLCALHLIHAADANRSPFRTSKTNPEEASIREACDQALERTQKRWREYTFTHAPEQQALSLSAPPPLALRGSVFQQRVWRALLDILPGETRSYAALARSIDQPQAARAVGSAVGANPVAVLVPCHRVITSEGKPGGYAWGVDIKLALLESEGVVFRNPTR